MLLSQIRRGAYYDSVVLMQLQRQLAALPGVLDAGVVMGTEANRDLLQQSGLLDEAAQAAKADDLVVVVRAQDEQSAQEAIGQVDPLLTRRTASQSGDNSATEGYRPKSLENAAQALPAAQWVLVSVPGRYAAGVATEALRLGKHVFLYSDNVSLADELTLKQTAISQGLLLMGPDCGTAIINGIGLGFANRVRRGKIGIIGASGTGTQHVTARIHQLGSGITHAIGTGGRDLSETIGGLTAQQALDLFARDPETQIIVLISKPPAPQVAEQLIQAARACGKPVIINFIGYHAPDEQVENLYFTSTLDATAELAVEFAKLDLPSVGPGGGVGQTNNPKSKIQNPKFAPGQRYLRGLFSGGTLAYEAQFLLAEYLAAIYSNAPLDKRYKLAKASESQGHTIVDLGEDEFTVGRLHPMLDNDLRIKRLLQEAADPETALILLDVVLGDGAHANPAAELAPAIAQARQIASEGGRYLEVVALVTGTDTDPQSLEQQIAQLQAVDVQVEVKNVEAVRSVGQLLQPLNRQAHTHPVSLELLHQPLSAINVGLESFTASLTTQGASVIQVDWRPPAGGNERLASLLAKMKTKKE